MRDPLITAIIPTFRRPALLRRAVESVLAQTYGELRVAIYDNASGDETEEVARDLMRHDARVTYHLHETNIGATANYNFGLSRVATPMFSFLGDDDYLRPGLYAEAVAALVAHPNSAFFCSRVTVANEVLGLMLPRNTTWTAGPYAPGPESVAHMVRDHFINTGIVFRADVLTTVGTLDRFGSDRNFVIVAAAFHPFVVTEAEGGVLTIHSGSFSGGARDVQFSDVDVFSHDVDYVLGANQTLLDRLRAADVPLDSTGRERVTTAIRAQTRIDLLYVYLVRSLPAGTVGDAKKILAARRELGLGWATRAFLTIFSLLSRTPLLARLAARAVMFAHRLLLRLGPGRRQ
jgi:glycosyltransferase involved in cell wall biosynthesis